jgi:hypothetical protein
MRKSVDIVHVNVRIREALRKKLADEAAKHRVSLNNEIRARLEASFEREGLQSLAESAATITAAHKSFTEAADDLARRFKVAVDRVEQAAVRRPQTTREKT